MHGGAEFHLAETAEKRYNSGTTIRQRPGEFVREVCCNTLFEETFVMRPCLLLFMLAVAVVAIAICGPPALGAVENLPNECLVLAETPALPPAVAQVVHDPGSCVSLSATVIDATLNAKIQTRSADGFHGRGCRLLNFLPSGC
jgi:hypothetical protein